MDYIINYTDRENNGHFTIKPYTTDGPALPSAEVPLDGRAVTANTSLILLGKGMFNYGESVAADFVHLLEHFSNSIPPVYPIQGQLWYKNDTKELFIYDGTSFYTQPIVINGLLQSDLDVTSNRIVNLADPIDPSDAVNKNFLTTTYVKRAGDTMTSGSNLSFDGGEVLGLPAIPTTDDAAASKLYVDTQDQLTLSNAIGSYLHKAGDTMTGNLVMTANTRIFIPTPTGGFTLGSDVVNKDYVDGVVSSGVGYVQSTGSTMTGLLTINGATISSGPALSLTNNASLLLAGNFTMTGSRVFNVGFNPIKDVGTPINSNDAATKYYVDQAVIAAGSGGGSDGTLSYVTFADNALTFTSTLGTPIVTGGIASIVHNHITSSINHNTTSTANLNSLLRPLFSSPSVSLQTVLDTIDNLLYTATAPNDRLLYTITIADGSTSPFTIPLSFAYSVEYNSLQVYKNGIKQYNSTRGVSTIHSTTPVSTIYGWQDTEIPAGSYSINTVVDGGTTTTIPVTIDYSPIAVTAVDDILNTWTVLGDQVNYFKQFSIFNVMGNVGLGVTVPYTVYNSVMSGGLSASDNTNLVAGTTYTATVTVDGTPIVISILGSTAVTYSQLIQQLNTDLGVSAVANMVNGSLVITSDSTGIGSTVSISAGTLFASPLQGFNGILTAIPGTLSTNGYQIINIGSITTITTKEDIVDADASGYIQYPYTFSMLVNDLQTSLDVQYPVAAPKIKLHNGTIYIYSPTTGTGSSIVVTDVDLLTASASYLFAFAVNDVIGADYGYKEIGIPFVTSQSASILTLPVVGDVYEFINIQ